MLSFFLNSFKGVKQVVKQNGNLALQNERDQPLLRQVRSKGNSDPPTLKGSPEIQRGAQPALLEDFCRLDKSQQLGKPKPSTKSYPLPKRSHFSSYCRRDKWLSLVSVSTPKHAGLQAPSVSHLDLLTSSTLNSLQLVGYPSTSYLVSL